MKLVEIVSPIGRMSPAEMRRHAAMHVVKMKPTIALLLRKVKHSTMSQHDYDSIKDVVDGMDHNKVMTKYELEQLATMANVDYDELAGLIGIDN